KQAVDSDNRAQRHRVPRAETENDSFVADLLSSRRGDGDGLCVDHFAHNSTGAVGGGHENWIKAELLSGDCLQAGAGGSGGGDAACEGNAEPSEKRSEEGIEPARTGEGQA